ncbi:hypothetical protein OKW21_002429 [Catalinimonas alkaloidigena]|uniref:hypothetical protein n=1 Tax=Catalinimonas alkaloidigena TaxID=1075417 RepID=UPI002404E15B|nr:hypothetical protein [Catalinimonas alkaloidigena]MDF9797166.1 hypothetical protein [Catalinimonas alkaloidigena]
MELRKISIIVIIIQFAMQYVHAQNTNTFQLHPENPHYFLYLNEASIIVGSAEHYGAVINMDFDYEKYLNTLGKEQLNNTRLFTGAYVEKQGDFGIQKNTLAPAEERLILPWKRSSEAGYALGGNKFDLSQWDDAYFQRLTNFMKLAAENEVIVEVTLFSAHYGNGWSYSAFNPQNNINQTSDVRSALVNTLENGNILIQQENYVRKIVRELNAFDNLYYEIQNEPWAEEPDMVFNRNPYGPDDDWRSKTQVVSQKSNAWQSRVAEWIRDEESKLPKQHLISQNISNFEYPITEPDPNISIFTFHYAFPGAVYQNYYLDRAIGLNETGFAGKADSTYSRQAWRFMMAGGSIFSHLDYSFSVGSEDGTDTTYDAPGGGSPALREQLLVLKCFFESIDFVKLAPDFMTIESSPGAKSLALSDQQSLWVMYIEPMALKSYPLTLNLPAGEFQAEWIAVESGKKLETTMVEGNQLNVPDFPGEKAVVIRKK